MEELEAAQNVRSEAVQLRLHAEEVLDDAESIQDQAEQVVAFARNTFAKAMALNPEALRPMAGMAGGGVKTQRQGNSPGQSEEEANWSRR